MLFTSKPGLMLDEIKCFYCVYESTAAWRGHPARPHAAIASAVTYAAGKRSAAPVYKLKHDHLSIILSSCN